MRAESADDDPSLPVVALVGRPNVGKSSMFNRLVGGRPALVEDVPGVTRDRRYGICSWSGARFRVVDTGGLDPSADGILRAMRAQTLRAVNEAAVVMFVLDVVEGVTAVDEEVATVLRRSGRPVLVAANKVDSAGRDAAVTEAFRLGFPRVFGVSASHGRGVGDVLDAVVEVLRAAPAWEMAAEAGGTRSKTSMLPIRIAFVGKPNVGKSSLVNRLLGDERVLVHDAPGTTRDPVDTPFSTGGRAFVLVDTAGQRRRRAMTTLTEKVAARMARDQIERSDVAVLVVDARAGATAEDAKLAGFVEESGRAAIVVLNKTDLVPRAEIDGKIEATREALGFMAWAPVKLASAVTGRGVDEIPREAGRAFEQAARRVPTAELNRLFEGIVARHPPPAGPGGRHVRLYYATQAETRPPTFFVSSNHPAAVGHAYRRFLANQIRKAWGFEGTPLRIVLRAHRQKRRRG